MTKAPHRRCRQMYVKITERLSIIVDAVMKVSARRAVASSCVWGFFVRVEVFLQGESCECGDAHYAHAGHLSSCGGQSFRGGRGEDGCGDGRSRGKVRARGAIVDVLADAGCEGRKICNGNRSAGRSKSVGRCVASLRSIEVEREMTYCSSLMRYMCSGGYKWKRPRGMNPCYRKCRRSRSRYSWRCWRRRSGSWRRRLAIAQRDLGGRSSSGQLRRPQREGWRGTRFASWRLRCAVCMCWVVICLVVGWL